MAAHWRTRRERGLRLDGFDYRAGRWYFVTIVTAGRRCTLGSVVDGAVVLSLLGAIVEAEWLALGARRHGVVLGPFVIMPNHLHALIWLPDRSTEPTRAASVPAGSLAAVVGGFKSGVWRRAAADARPLWQTRFHDRIVRSDEEHERIAAYIAANPARWEWDRENSGSGVPWRERDPEWPARAKV